MIQLLLLRIWNSTDLSDLTANYCAAGAKALGVSDVSTAKGEYAPVAVLGILLIEAAGTIAVGDAVASDAEGKAVKVADSAITNGYALDAGTAGQEIRILKGC